MIRLATTNESGPSTVNPGIRYGLFASGTCLRKDARASGAPAYISTLAEVTKPTSSCQLGNGRKTTRPMTNEKIRPNHGTPRLSVLPKIGGKYLFLARP